MQLSARSGFVARLRLQRNGIRSVLLAACLLAPFDMAQADVTTRDLQIAARTLGFLEPSYTGEIRMGLLYDAASTRSSQQAMDLQRLLGDGMTVGNLRLQPVLVQLSDAARADVQFFFLTEGTGGSNRELPGILALRKLPCLTTDTPQVRAGVCTIGIQSLPKVEILVNSAAATASNTRFASVFRMMIVEL